MARHKNKKSWIPNENSDLDNARSQEISITVPYSIFRSLDWFLKHGNTRTLAVNMNGVDINKASLVRMLISAYGYEQSKLSFIVNSRIWRGDTKNGYISLRTANPSILKNPSSRVSRLVNAMVFANIPIYKYDYKTGKKIGTYFDLRTKVQFEKFH